MMNNMDEIKPLLEKELNEIPLSIPKEAEILASRILDKAGIYYRVFARAKSTMSTLRKMGVKNYDSTHKMQDLLGVRVVLYFKDDVDICVRMLKSELELVNESIDDEKEDTFKPTRLNLVFKLPESIIQLFNKTIWTLPIDKTFEVQVRTIFSEGWHEVEHDLRYKNKEDWETIPKLSRSLNGIYATLDTCDWAILQVFSELAYRKYKNEEWECMLRNHWRIHLTDDRLSDRIAQIFNDNKEVAKAFYRIPRERVIKCISDKKATKVPRTMSNIVYMLNLEVVHDIEIRKITPAKLIEIVGSNNDTLDDEA